ncbi:MAG: YihY/virulence factor BrkB family protein [Fibrobacterota bacterium]
MMRSFDPTLKRFWGFRANPLARELVVLFRSMAMAIRDLSESGAFTQAAAISYYTILSIFPFLMLLVVVSTRLLEDQNLSIQAIRLLGSYMPNGRQILTDSLPVLQRISGTLGTVSVLGLAWTSMGLFAALRIGLDQVSGDKTPPSSLLQHWASLVAVIASSVGLLLGLALVTLLSFVGRFSLEVMSQGVGMLGRISGELPELLMRPAGLAFQAVTIALSGAVTWVGLVMLMHHLPRHKPGIRHCLVPALVVTLLMDQLKGWFLLFVGSRKDFTMIHGPLSAAIAFMIWAYLSALLFLYGGAWTFRLMHERSREARLRPVSPEP